MEQTERNAHVHPALRGVLNAFCDTRPLIDAATVKRSAELQSERLLEWRQDDREREALERKEREK